MEEEERMRTTDHRRLEAANNMISRALKNLDAIINEANERRPEPWTSEVAWATEQIARGHARLLSINPSR
jgi:CRISPR/Cas system-associated endonuclease Cas1